MKVIKLGILTLLIATTSACTSTSTKTYSSYDEAAKDATVAIDKAKSVNYEWRDSRKLLKKAAKLAKDGKSNEAIKMATKAKQQGDLAIAQAEQQSGVSGPHN
ncbi:hypothetical protein MNBD_GAMMA05-1704 [hydrothermal vent metagenome]|uniref:DUF4398 domain-containing protein n=1 Tax=hydrothermal vent metagenome TaxID=652676 RepID=A0A3B0WR20_9ZZZZ